MQQQEGLGDVLMAAKNMPLLDSTAEKLTAVPHQNGKDYWIICHGWDNNAFYVYLLSEAGLGSQSIYQVSTLHRGGGLYTSGAIGYLKASPDGKKLAAAVYQASSAFELFDFDDATGRLTNPVTLGTFSYPYGVSFSPDNTKLYVTSALPEGMYQFDLAAGSMQAIIASQTNVDLTFKVNQYTDTLFSNGPYN